MPHSLELIPTDLDRPDTDRQALDADPDPTRFGSTTLLY
jgi:hypothetical protein